LTYFSDQSVYQVSNSDYQILVSELSTKDISSPGFSGFSHLLFLKTKKLQTEELEITVLSKVPAWVNNSSSTDDSNIKSDTSEQNKTFGLSYLVEGVSEAFNYYPSENENIVSKIKIKISK
jgi:hypothetical protein